MSARSASAPLVSQGLIQKAQSVGQVRVIVELAVSAAAQQAGDSDIIGDLRRKEVAQGRDSVRASLLGTKHSVVRQYEELPFLALQIGIDGLQTLDSLHGLVTRVVEDGLNRPFLGESSPLVQADQVWAGGFGGTPFTGAGTVIAILDSGVDKNHPFLAGKVVEEACFSSNDPSYGATSVCPGGVTTSFAPGSGLPCNSAIDGCEHGTHVAGIAAARVDNGLGVAGVAPEAKIMPVRVLAADGYADGDSVEQGIRWAADHGADVINLSLGADVLVENIFGRALTDAVNYAWSKGAIPVVVTGNDGLFRTEFDDANAMVVTATTQDDRLAEYATGAGFAKWGLAAPGGSASGDIEERVYSSIWSRDGKAHYAYGAGTSMAAPHVSGAAAILRSLGFSPTETVGRLLATAKDLGSRGSDGSYGRGRLDVAAAVAGLKPASTKLPTTSSPSSASPPSAAPAGDSNRPAETLRATNSGATPEAKVTESAEPAPELRRAQSADESKSEGRGVVAYLALGAAVLASAVSIGFLRLRRG